MAQRLRYWMSGGLAVISLALAGLGDAWVDDEAAPRGAWRTSHFDMAQTLSRVQQCAPRHGLELVARWMPPAAGPAAPSASDGISSAGCSILVFASLDGGTPVLMRGEWAAPALPLSLRLRTRDDGRVEVLLPPASVDDLPGEVARNLGVLPDLVAEALG